MKMRSGDHRSPRSFAPRGGARIVLRIGITGHRHIPAESRNELKALCRTVLLTAQTAIREIAEAKYPGYSDDIPLVRAVTCLASGSDQVFAEAALELKGSNPAGIETWAILPFKEDVYRTDFQTTDGSTNEVEHFDQLIKAVDQRTELEGSRQDLPSRLRAYEDAGKLMLSGCDLIVSICSPTALPKQGGSIRVTEEAIAAGIPVVVVDPDKPTEAILRKLGGKTPYDQTSFTESSLRESIRQTLIPPNIRDRELGEARWNQIRDQVITLSEPSSLERQLSTIYKLPWQLLLVFSRAGKNSESKKVDRPATPLKEIYERAEKRSKHYAILWRGSFLFNYILGATAVTCALLQYATQAHGPAWTITEAATLLLLLLNYRYGQERCWHASFGDMRFLAELIRQARAMSLVGAMIPRLQSATEDSHLGREAWIIWYCRALQRSLLPAEASLCEIYHWTLAGWIDKQRDYHHGYAESRTAVEDFLKHGEVILFISACLACAVHLTNLLPEKMEPWLVFSAAAAPAWAAALHAISIQGEFKTIAETSEATSLQLERITTEASQALARGSASRGALILTSRAASGVMMQEAAGWRAVSQMHQMLPS